LNKERILKLIVNPTLITDVDVPVLRDLAEAFPASAPVQMLYLKGLQKNQSYLYQKQLKRAALTIPNRQRLFDFLQGPLESNEIMVEAPFGNVAGEAADAGETTQNGFSAAQNEAVATVEKEASTESVLEISKDKSSEALPVFEPSEEVEQTAAKTGASSTFTHQAEAIEAQAGSLMAAETDADATLDKLEIKSSAQKTATLEGASSSKEDTATAAKVLEDGTVAFDLDRVDARTRAVIERSLALRARLAQKKGAVETKSEGSLVEENPQHQTTAINLEAAEIASEDLATDIDLGPLNVEPEGQFVAIPPTDILAAPSQDLSANESGEITAEMEREITEASDIADATWAFPLLVFSANEIETLHENPSEGKAQLGNEPEAASKINEREIEEASKEVTRIVSDELIPADQGSTHTFFEWIQLLEQRTHPKPKVVKAPTDKLQLIDSFLKKVPTLKPSKEAYQTKETNNKPLAENPREQLMTETLANVYLSQKHYDKAIGAFEILRLKYPEKSSYFADLILKVKKLKNSPE